MSFTMCAATVLTLQGLQILRLPRKMTLMSDVRHTWNVIYNVRSNRHHPPTSPNTAPATQNCIPKSKPNCQKTNELSFSLRDRFEHDPSMIRPWTRHGAPARSPRLLFTHWRRIFYWKWQHFALPLSTQISPNTAPATKIDTPRSPNAAPATKNDTPRSPNTAPATNSDTPRSPNAACACHEKWLASLILVTWNVIYNARSSSTHPPTSPNIAPATQNDSHERCPSHMKRHFYNARSNRHHPLLYWTVTLLSCYFTELLLYWTITLLSCYFTELLPYWTVTLLKCYFTELLLYWTVALLSCYFTELLLCWTVTLLSRYFTELLLCGTVTLLNYYFTELLLYWAVTLLSCYFTGLLLYWTVTLLSCYFTELLLYWTVTELLLYWAVIAFLNLRNSEVSQLNFLSLRFSSQCQRTKYPRHDCSSWAPAMLSWPCGGSGQQKSRNNHLRNHVEWSAQQSALTPGCDTPFYMAQQFAFLHLHLWNLKKKMCVGALTIRIPTRWSDQKRVPAFAFTWQYLAWQ